MAAVCPHIRGAMLGTASCIIMEKNSGEYQFNLEDILQTLGLDKGQQKRVSKQVRWKIDAADYGISHFHGKSKIECISRPFKVREVLEDTLKRAIKFQSYLKVANNAPTFLLDLFIPCNEVLPRLDEVSLLIRR